jgi:iron(III) transport system substrate-binding protein
MKKPTFSRRDVLQGSTALAASSVFASVASAAPPASAVTPQLIEAAKKEGKVVFYTSIDLPVAERLAHHDDYSAHRARRPASSARALR